MPKKRKVGGKTVLEMYMEKAPFLDPFGIIRRAQEIEEKEKLGDSVYSKLNAEVIGNFFRKNLIKKWRRKKRSKKT